MESTNKSTNNIERFRNIIASNPPTLDEYYFVQIIKRKKDGHDANGNNLNRCVKYYNIKSLEDFDNVKDEIVSICEALNTRAYIYYSKKSFKETAKLMLKRVTDNIISENYIGMKASHQACCSECVPKEKTYLIDVDTKDTTVMDIINKCLDQCEPYEKNKVVDIIPSKSGFHIITIPFNVAKFRTLYKEDIDIHKNSPTILYVK